MAQTLKLVMSGQGESLLQEVEGRTNAVQKHVYGESASIFQRQGGLLHGVA